jgi:hypothetical protein
MTFQFPLRLLQLYLLPTFALIASTSTMSNGINPPRPVGSTILDAVCKKNSGAEDVELGRVRFVNAGNPAVLYFITSAGDSIEINASELLVIKIEEPKTDEKGFVSAEITTRGLKAKGMLLVKPPKSGLLTQLSGFNKSNERVAIDIPVCATISITQNSP